MTVFLVYLFLTLPKLAVLFGCLAIAALLPILVLFFYNFVENEKIVLSKKILITGICCLFVSVFLPSKQDSYILAGVYATQVAVNSETGQDVIELVKKKIKESIKE